jgi:hypothetical protein
VKVLLDEDVPRPLRRELVGHDVSTVPEMGWAGVTNGVLLGLAASAGFGALLTCDRGIQHQQNVSALGIALVVLAVPNKKLDTIRSLVPEILALLDAAPGPGTVTVVGNLGGKAAPPLGHHEENE